MPFPNSHRVPWWLMLMAYATLVGALALLFLVLFNIWSH
jgi:hypothetical protein